MTCARFAVVRLAHAAVTVLTLSVGTAHAQDLRLRADQNPPAQALPGAIPRGGLQAVPIMPAPEVVRLWTPEVCAKAKLTPSFLVSVADLDSRDWARRQAASARLADPSVTAEEIFAVLVRGALTPEQVERLLALAQAKVLALPRGALGLRMQPSGDLAHPGVEVILLIPKMPAEKVLKLGDRIERIDGKPIATSTDLVEIIQSKLPGESVRLSVARPIRDERGKPRLDANRQVVEEQLTLDVPLASATDLEQFEDRLAPKSRSVILERRLLALREAHERFAPKAVKVRTIPVADRDLRAAPPTPSAAP